MNAPAFLGTDHHAAAIREARIELTTVLAWIEHWQRDVAVGLRPTDSSLEKVAANIRKTLEEIAP
jgi:hypothetical protein